MAYVCIFLVFCERTIKTDILYRLTNLSTRQEMQTKFKAELLQGLHLRVQTIVKVKLKRVVKVDDLT